MKKQIFYLLFWAISVSVSAQESKGLLHSQHSIVYDTLVVYDTIFVTDTVRLLDNNTSVKALENLPFQFILLENNTKNKENEQILILNKNFAATFSHQRILLSDTKNHKFTIKKSDKMKKINFFGLAFIAFQNMVIAQDLVSFSLGSGLYNQQTSSTVTIDYNNIKGKSTTQAKPFIKLGAHLSWLVFQDEFRVETGLQYYFLQRSDFQPFASDPKFLTVYSGGENFSKNLQMFTLPLSVQWNRYKMMPIIGAEFFYKLKPKTSFLSATATTPQQTNYNVPIYGFSSFVGLGMRLGKQLEARLTYNKGLTSEQLSQPNGNQYSTKMNRYEIGFRYDLLKK